MDPKEMISFLIGISESPRFSRYLFAGAIWSRWSRFFPEKRYSKGKPRVFEWPFKRIKCAEINNQHVVVFTEKKTEAILFGKTLFCTKYWERRFYYQIPKLNAKGPFWGSGFPY